MSSYRVLVVYLCTLVLWAAAAEGAEPPLLGEEEAVRLLTAYRSDLEGKVIASIPTIVSDSGELLDSMGPVPTNPRCFDAWKKALEDLVAEGYLSDYYREEHTVGIRTAHITVKGAPFFGPAYPARFHTTVTIIPNPGNARVMITAIESEGPPGRIRVEFRCPPCEPFGILWRNGVFTANCQGRVDESIVMETGAIRGHAHLARKGGRWHVVRFELGPHRTKD